MRNGYLAAAVAVAAVVMFAVGVGAAPAAEYSGLGVAPAAERGADCDWSAYTLDDALSVAAQGLADDWSADPGGWRGYDTAPEVRPVGTYSYPGEDACEVARAHLANQGTDAPVGIGIGTYAAEWGSMSMIVALIGERDTSQVGGEIR